MSNNAKINIVVTEFVANNSPTPVPPFCVISKPTIANGPGGSGPQDASGQVGIDATGAIWVNRKNSAAAPVNLAFTITGAAGAFTPTSIKFSQQVGTGDQNGTQNFRNIVASGATVAVDDFWTLHGQKKVITTGPAPKWKYSIPVRLGGQSGWIDPGVENADDM